MADEGWQPVIEMKSSDEFMHYEIRIYDESIGAGWLAVFDETDTPITIVGIEQRGNNFLSSTIYVRRAACGN